MNFKAIITYCALPLAIFAQDSTAVSNEVIPEAPAIQDTPAQQAETTVDTASVSPASSEASFSAVETASGEMVETANEVAVADSTEADSAEADDGKEMSQEEADAELAAAMGSPADSAKSSDSLSHKLMLDMTTAFVPTESRRIAGPYGLRVYRMHRGVDLGLCHGEDRTIVAAFAGKVKLVRNQGRRKGYGKYVVIDHGNGLTTLYAHLASWKVNIGDTVQAGDTIGIGGNTGRSFGAHLHFEMKYNGVYIDPTTVFNFEEGTFVNAMAEIDQTKLQTVEDGYQKELSKHRYYKVRSGDCLGKIAKKYGISITRLKQLNHIKGNMIRPGQMLRCS